MTARTGDSSGPVERLARARRRVPKGAKWWFPICALTLIIASDYELRQRDPTDALSASIDYAIVVELGLYGLVAGYLALTHAGTPKIGRMRPHLYFACLLIGLMALSLSYTPYTEYAAVRVVQMGILLLLVLLGVAYTTRAHYHRFAHAYLALVVLSALYGVMVPSTPIGGLQQGRFTWLAIHPTVSGVLAGLAVIVAMAYVAAGRRPRPGPMWPQPVYVGALVVVGAALLGSHTRGAILGAAVGALVLVLALRRGRTMIESVLVITVLLVGVGLAASEPVADFFQRDASPESLASLNNRTGLWDVSMTAVAENPMFGYGVTAAQGIFYEETGLGGGHNAVVNLVVELGVVGLLTWLALIVSLFVGTRRLAKDGRDHLAFDRALILAVLVFLLVDGIFFQGPGAVTNVASTWLFICVAWLSVAQRAGSERQRDMIRGAIRPAPASRPVGVSAPSTRHG
jgi:exopolysaccharide production protein ExoQ